MSNYNGRCDCDCDVCVRGCDGCEGEVGAEHLECARCGDAFCDLRGDSFALCEGCAKRSGRMWSVERGMLTASGTPYEFRVRVYDTLPEARAAYLSAARSAQAREYACLGRYSPFGPSVVRDSRGEHAPTGLGVSL